MVHFVGPALSLAERAAGQGARVYAYLFDWAPPASPFGAGHCIDLAFAFGTWKEWADAPMLVGGDPAMMAALSATLRRAITSFVADGAPQPGPFIDWPPYAPARTLLSLGRAITTLSGGAGCLAGDRPS